MNEYLKKEEEWKKGGTVSLALQALREEEFLKRAARKEKIHSFFKKIFRDFDR